MKPCEAVGMCTPDTNILSVSNSVIIGFEVILIIFILGLIGYNIYKKNFNFLKKFSITTISVVLFEIVVDPYVITKGFSSWSYYYHDLTIFLTFSWVLGLIGVISLVDKLYYRTSEFKKFWLYLALIDFLTLIVEIILVKIDIRTYSQSTLDSSYGLFIPLTAVPIGLIFLVPAMFTLGITFIKYWEYILESKK